MTDTIKVLIDAAYALACAAGALIWPPLALVFAVLFLLAQAILADRRTSTSVN